MGSHRESGLGRRAGSRGSGLPPKAPAMMKVELAESIKVVVEAELSCLMGAWPS